jgi:hypothetical protein
VFKNLAAQLKKECSDKYDMGEATQTLKMLLEENNL